MLSERCVRESEIIDPTCVERAMSTSEIIKEIRKELAETISCLANIKFSIDGECINERKTDEPKCMNDEIKIIERMAVDCIGLSHEIHDKLFRTDCR